MLGRWVGVFVLVGIATLLLVSSLGAPFLSALDSTPPPGAGASGSVPTAPGGAAGSAAAGVLPSLQISGASVSIGGPPGSGASSSVAIGSGSLGGDGNSPPTSGGVQTSNGGVSTTSAVATVSAPRAASAPASVAPGSETANTASFSGSASGALAMPHEVDPVTKRPLPTGTTYTVQFSERGLPAGTIWSVTVNNQPQSAAAGSVIQYQLANGSYPYTITPIPGYHESNVPYSGPILVENTTYIVPTLQWFQFTFPITFSETGLPTTSSWGVTINDTLEFEPTGTPIVGEVPNGSYTYSISDYSGYHQLTLAYSGAGTISGTGITEPTLAFAPVQYTVTFTEAGLPVGVSWSVTANGVPQTAPSGTAITSTVANGTFPFSIGGVAGYHQPTLPYSGGHFVVAGSSFPEPTLQFVPFVYAVTFTESGLPSGGNTFWGVSVNGSLYSAPAGGSIGFALSNGTVPYTIPDVPGFHQTTMSYSGTLTVSGAPLTEPTLVFSAVTYSVTFTESGLVPGTQWTVTLQGSPQSSTSSSITFVEPNGTHLPLKARCRWGRAGA